MVIKMRRTLTRSGTIRSSKSIRARLNLVRMLQINALVFFICLTPYEIINLNNMVKDLDTSGFLSSESHHYISWIGRITMLVNSAVNPLIYSIVNPTYRKEFLHCCCCCLDDTTCNRKRPRSTTYDMVSRSGHSPRGNWYNDTRYSRTQTTAYTIDG